MITFTLTDDGAFVAGDYSTGLTCYAYPTSANATRARRNPKGAAEDMLRHQFACTLHDRGPYDKANWKRLSDAGAVSDAQVAAGVAPKRVGNFATLDETEQFLRSCTNA
jgi:hypothetical protein